MATTDKLLTEQSAPAFEWSQESTVEGTVIRNVLLCGNISRNGRKIPATAFKNDAHVSALYKNKHVYLNHLPNDRLRGTLEQAKAAATTRPIQELAGYIIDARLVDGKPRGDIETGGCFQGESLLKLANAKVPNVGLSHVAAYRTRREGAMLVVESVEDVAAVDVVTSPATTNTFSEQTQSMTELEKALSDLNAATAKAVSLEQANRELTEKLVAADSKIAALATEKLSLEQKIADNDQKIAQEQLRLSIQKRFDEAGIKIGSEQCSMVFVESVLSCADEAKRNALIEDRLSIVRAVKTPHTPERKNDRKDGVDPVADALNSPKLFV